LDDTDAVRDLQGKTKEWFLLNLDKNFETYIDHGCILDKQGYPIYPNWKKVFVLKPGDTVTNFGAVGFSSNKRGINNARKVARYFCLSPIYNFIFLSRVLHQCFPYSITNLATFSNIIMPS
jgi:hypothetical protein